jgi:hypothetical protein
VLGFCLGTGNDVLRLSFRSPAPLRALYQDRLRFFAELARGIKLRGNTS